MIGLEPTRLTTPDPKSGAGCQLRHIRGIIPISGSKDRKEFSFWQIVFVDKVVFRKSLSVFFLLPQWWCPSHCFSSSLLISTFLSGSMPNSICCFWASRCGLAEKAYPPSVGQFRREWQARPSAGFITNQGDIGKTAHGIDKIIGCTIGMTICQDNYLFFASGYCWKVLHKWESDLKNRYGLCQFCAEYIPSVLFLFVKRCTIRVAFCQVAATVVAHVDNQAIASGKV